MHDNNVVHRDIKPENIMLEGSTQGELDTIKIIDFGTAARSSQRGCAFKEKVGTFAYMAPEIMIKSPKEEPEPLYDEQVDMWSLGVMAYALLCGRLPFTFEDHN